MLYPLKFQPITKPKVWGSETWALSGYGDDESVVANGFLKDNLLSEVQEIYMDELVGGKVYDRFGNFFPLLFKFIDAKDDLSIQVHPTDEQAAAEEQLGKTEMWYVTEAESDATIILGFSRDTTEQEVRRRLEDDTVLDVLQVTPVRKGDVAFIPAGRVHALRRGTQVAEIQETSDLTYRLYDYHRPGLDGKLRPLHVEESMRCLDFKALSEPLTEYPRRDGLTTLVQDSHFVTNMLQLSHAVERDYAKLDSFVVYMCVEGSVTIHCPDTDCEDVSLQQGETLLVPAVINDVVLTPHPTAKLLEVFVD
ncbi:MAG: class I mannose-6-phosphate isomerase [Paludibacteraceae bacterium]|nr:class I mannose-6-phosphate isomerase [Paludibacteraceae bacterium]